MDFLRPQFESAIEPFVQGDVVQVGRFGYTGADILKLAGEDAYKQAFGDWVWDEWVPTRRERKDELLKLNSNAARFNDLEKMIASSGAIPFVGSGMSAPTGMPTWGQFLRDTRKLAKGGRRPRSLFGDGRLRGCGEPDICRNASATFQ